MSNVEGLDKLKAQLRKLKDVDKAKAMLAGAYTLQKYSMENAPVKTGFLKNSHSSRETKDGAEMVVGANYSYYVEFGTSKWSGKPFVRPAIDTHMDEIAKAVANQVEAEIRKKI